LGAGEISKEECVVFNNLPKSQKVLLILLAVITCLVCTLVAAVIIQQWRGGARPPAANATSPVDPAWARIQTSGRIVVGVAAGYPPFEYYNSSYQLDGFDIALMRDIGQKLGVRVEFQDLVFEFLGPALEIQQVDATISAISVTPERLARADFSNTYYVSKEGILANANSPIQTITSPDQLAQQRVGVESGSVYEQWVRTNLVDTGKMAADKLLAYPRADTAVSDLRNGRVDLVVLDYYPAVRFAEAGGVKVVGQGISQQLYAIAMKKGSPTLQAKINQALVELQNEGRIAQLSQIYLGAQPPPPEATPTPLPTSPPPPPTPTLPPVPSATPPNVCIDGMAFVADLTYPDYNMTAIPLLPPGTPFQKGWRIRNTGTCTWNSSYVLRYVGGNHPSASMGGAPTPILGVVLPGATYDMYVNLVAPIQPGVYQGFWALHNPLGQPLGQRLWVAIQVPPPATSTPLPRPIIQRFDVQPASIQMGQCVNISWEILGAVNTVRLQRDNTVLWDGAPTRGQTSDCPPAPATVTYQIIANGPGGSANGTRQVTVFPPVDPTAPPPPTQSPAPQIVFFNIQPNSIDEGQCTSISWQITGEVTLVRLSRNGQIILDNASTSYQGSDCPTAGAYTYQLDALGNKTGDSQQRQLTVNPLVGPLPAPIPAPLPAPLPEELPQVQPLPSPGNRPAPAAPLAAE
jgi:ABC-type amino acid transport substrate-binding protein